MRFARRPAITSDAERGRAAETAPFPCPLRLDGLSTCGNSFGVVDVFGRVFSKVAILDSADMVLN